MRIAKIPLTLTHILGGIPHSANWCPLALAFNEALPGKGVIHIHWTISPVYANCIGKTVLLPNAMRIIVQMVDNRSQVQPGVFQIEIPGDLAVFLDWSRQ